jgi:adhesin/invasin
VVTSGVLAPNASCVLEVSVAGQAEGSYSTNPVGFASAQTGAGASTVVATLSVLPPRSVAPTPPTSPASAAQSSVVVSPATVAADGTAMATITVTLRTADGTPVAGKRVLLASSRGLIDTIAAATGNTDANGVYTTTIRSRTPGVTSIKAYVSPDGVYLTEASLTFQ